MSENKSKVGIWTLFAKLGSKIVSVLIKILKGLKFAKVGLAAASFAGYALIFSWKFALLLMFSLAFHESGHVWAMKKMGIKTKGFYFIPFIGGAAIAEEQYKTYGQNAYISIMGPIWGAVLAGACAILYAITGAPLWAAASAWMATLNLFNLLPITPLDGGQLMKAIAFSIHKSAGLIFWIVSILLGVAAMWYFKIGLFALILIVGSLDLGLEVYRRRTHNKIYGRVSQETYIHEMGQLKHPNSMDGNQIAMTAFAYMTTTLVLVLILTCMKHIPGADIAANFLQ